VVSVLVDFKSDYIRSNVEIITCQYLQINTECFTLLFFVPSINLLPLEQPF